MNPVCSIIIHVFFKLIFQVDGAIAVYPDGSYKVNGGFYHVNQIVPLLDLITVLPQPTEVFMDPGEVKWITVDSPV